MVQTYTTNELDGSTSGRQIKVTGTATGTAVTIHTAVSGTGSSFDDIIVEATNTSTTDVLLTLEWGGTTSPDDLIKKTIPGHGQVTLDGSKFVKRGLLQDSLVVKAFADTANVINISGKVIEIRG